MSLPKELNLASNKPMASSGRPQILRFRSDNSSYTQNDTIRIEIPTSRQGQYLFASDRFLEFKLKINSTNALAAAVGDINLALDQSIYSFFNRIRVLHGSTVLEDTLYCHRLWTALYDIQINEAERRGHTINMGVKDNAVAGNTQIFNTGLYGQTVVTRTGAGTATVTQDSALFDYNFVIPSSIFGTLASKALPLSLLGASSLYIELELAPLNVAFVSWLSVGTAAGVLNSYTVQDIYYNAKISVLPLEIEQALIASTEGVINLRAISYKCKQKSIAATSQVFNDKFSFQYSSIKSFLFWVQNTITAAGTITTRSVSSRPKANINDYYLNINGELFPSQSITGYARQYTELLRSFDLLSDTNAGGILTLSNYSNDVSTIDKDIIDVAQDITTDQKRWIGGIDLDRFNRSSDVLMSGTSTIDQMLSLAVNLSAGNLEALNFYGACMYLYVRRFVPY